MPIKWLGFFPWAPRLDEPEPWSAAWLGLWRLFLWRIVEKTAPPLSSLALFWFQAEDFSARRQIPKIPVASDSMDNLHTHAPTERKEKKTNPYLTRWLRSLYHNLYTSSKGSFGSQKQWLSCFQREFSVDRVVQAWVQHFNIHFATNLKTSTAGF